MASIISLSKAAKSFGQKSLFSGLSVSIEDGERLAIVGPNGSGKSTLLKIFAGLEDLDDGELVRRKDLRVSLITQSCHYPDEVCVNNLLGDVSSDRKVSYQTYLSRLGISETEVSWSSLSGGQKKRVQIAAELSCDPDLLLLDEPTNHLDLESILILEQYLCSPEVPPWVLISHDRAFMKQCSNRILDINKAYYNSFSVYECDYDTYLERRQEIFVQEEKHLQNLQNKARREKEWLHQGIKARGTRSKKRVEEAESLFKDIGVRTRKRAHTKKELGLYGSERKTKKLVEAKSVSKSYGNGKEIIRGFSTVLGSGSSIGVLGKNGSGKSTLLKLIAGLESSDAGTVKHADNLSVAYFTQEDEFFSKNVTLREVLLDEGEYVHYLGKPVHIASWADRLGFEVSQLSQPYDSLSGGERARARLARLLTHPADLVIMDEPTNDLDIESIEMLEGMLCAFEGASVLVSHDRRLLENVCFEFWCCENSQVEIFASLNQALLFDGKANQKVSTEPQKGKVKERPASKKLTYKEQFEYDNLPSRIDEAEMELERKTLTLSTLQNSGAPEEIDACCLELSELSKKVEEMYARWEALEQKQKELENETT